MNTDRKSLSRLTLRQLRHTASDLGVPLYSRKSKAALINEINLYLEKRDADKSLFSIDGPKESESVRNDSQTKVVFLPRDPEWAYVFWEISDQDRQNALSQGANRLCLRLSDVTGNSDGLVNRGTLQEVIVDSHSTEWYLPIPLGGRDYNVEIGYRIGHQWMSLAFSSTARVPSLHPSDQILDQFVPFSLEAVASKGASETDFDVVIEQPDSGLHERLYQSATTKFRTSRIGSEEFQESPLSTGSVSNNSGAGLWASGRNDSGSGVLLETPKSFWLVADAELIVYGATDPTASLTIEGEDVPLATDGTFRLQVPFRDGLQNYSIKAVDTDSEQKRNITMIFERKTPEDNTNPNQKSESEWF